MLLSGDVINKMYFPILVPVGVIGNFLSFLVRTYLYLKLYKMSTVTLNLPCVDWMCSHIIEHVCVYTASGKIRQYYCNRRIEHLCKLSRPKSDWSSEGSGGKTLPTSTLVSSRLDEIYFNQNKQNRDIFTIINLFFEIYVRKVGQVDLRKSPC